MEDTQFDVLVRIAEALERSNELNSERLDWDKRMFKKEALREKKVIRINERKKAFTEKKNYRRSNNNNGTK